ncbi:MAG TPA: SDR family NAD(P)-dependent oxidoreductase [Polyangiaceae bacterium]|jgi:NADP-dependent 3-hydroxy acid dehydrogenase YdfG|nr:SDR family NAD(P)-dependent oxidoreductase [Polyangiaceae bacterium]
MSGVIVVNGYGPGISNAVARRFGREGFAVALVGRTEERLAKGAAALEAEKIRAKAFKCDVGDADAVRAMLASVRSSLGPIEVVHWNAYVGAAGDLTTAPASEVHAVLDVMVHGLLAAVQDALPDLEKSKGAVLVTGGGLSKYDPATDEIAGSWNAMGLALGKAAQHKLVGLLNKKLAARGVFVGEVTVLGLVKGTLFDSGNATIDADTIAERFYELFRSRKEPYAEVG